MSKHAQKKYFDATGNLIVKPYRTIDLCNIFDVDYKTMRNWIAPYHDEIGEKQGMYYTIEQVAIMLSKFGRPHIIVTPP